ncbi:MAG: pilus assembly protein, partial [Stenotrophobium sp.]
AHACSGQWSGNFLNWATLSTIDPFRWALTGGYRSVDTAAGAGPAQTILERAWQAVGQGSFGHNNGSSTANGDDFTDHAIYGTTVVSGATPSNAACLVVRSGSLGNLVYFAAGSGGSGNNSCSSISSNFDSGSINSAPATITYYTGGSVSASSSTIYEMAVRVQVCDPTLGGTQTANEKYLESDCTIDKYVPLSTSTTAWDYKPEGLMQQYSQQVRYGVFGYLNDSGNARDGGVLRANMKFIGAQQFVPGAAASSNPNNEWSSTTGVYIADPGSPPGAAASGATPSADVANTNTACATACASSSGVLNYLNGFGEAAHKYKSSDNVSELYYAAVRYFKGPSLGNVPNWSSLTATNSSPSVSTLNTYTDGFPVITTWQDPLPPANTAYECAKNFILGIGDQNTHADGDLPNNPKFDGDSYNPAWSSQTPSASGPVSADSGLNTQKATNKVGTLENADSFSGPLTISTSGTGLGDTTVPWCCNDHNTFGMAGIAYDAHVNDQRPNDFKNDLNADGTKVFTQTISTYWLDVQEYQKFRYQNQAWLTAKYGGFTVPAGYSEYGNTTPLAQNLWDTNGQTETDSSGTLRNLPDHYYPASNALSMVNGLNQAFADIASQVSATTTAFSTVKPQLQQLNNAVYGASYDAGNWTGQIEAVQLSFDSSGNPTLTPQWFAQTTLDANSAGTGWKNRVLLTNNGTPGSTGTSSTGVLFNSTNLTNTTSINALKTYCPDLNSTNCINWLSGDQSNEGSKGDGAYRVRAHLLGDIADAHLAPVGPPQAGFSDGLNPGYGAFVTQEKNRPVIVYAAANDGMLHAFDGSLSDGKNGAELFAYVPSFGFTGPGTNGVIGSAATPGVNGLPSYGNKGFVHHFFVDATPAVFDIDFSNTNGLASSGNWHSVLIGGLGKGGAGYYALDVSDPTGVATTSPGPIASSDPAHTVLWEFTDADMGYSYGDPVVVKTKQYGWVVLLTTGYNNPDGIGKLYVVNPTNGKLLQTISTAGAVTTTTPAPMIGTAANPSGLAWVSAFVSDFRDDTTDAAYAVDLFGQVWRFDLTAKTGSYPAPTLLATLTDAGDANASKETVSSHPDTQAITTRPLIEVDPSTNNRYVLVGTGKQLGPSDLSTGQIQDFYVIADGTNTAFMPAASIPGSVITRSELADDTAQLVPSSGTPGVGTVTNHQNGFYINLDTGPDNPSYRVTVTPTANFGIVGFAANKPTGGVCTPSGVNQVYEFRFGGTTPGASVLTDSSGTLVSNISSSGEVTSMSFENINGEGTKLYIGTDVGGTVNIIGAGGFINIQPKFKFLNWQDVTPSN